jgi:predicted MFS family arabinose efflux permease
VTGPVSAFRPSADTGASGAGTGLSAGQLVLIGLACAVCVANNYYSQPLLIDIARDLGMSRAMSGLAPTLTQAGIAAGMLFLLPLGDRTDNRRIVVALLAIQAVALVVMAVTAGAALFLAAALSAGMCGIVTYLLPAYATRLVAPDRRGTVTGTLATGIMTGIMLGRSVAGIAGYEIGWRSVYGLAAVATLVMAALMGKVMPPTPGLRDESYFRLLASLGTLARDIPLLRLATLLQAISFGVFNALWVGIALHLQEAPFDLNTRQIGELALVAITGALAAPILGRLADRYSMSTAVRLLFGITAVGWVAMLALPGTYFGIVTGMVLVGIGATGSDVVLRTALYGLQPDVRMRLNSVYSTGTFAGGSLFSFATPLIWTKWGWTSVCIGALAATLAGMLLIPRSAAGAPGSARQFPRRVE